MKNSKEVKGSLWPRIGAGVDRHEVVGAKCGVVDIAVGERTMMLPAKGVLPGKKTKREMESNSFLCQYTLQM